MVSWHRAGYRLFWKWRSRRQRVGRPKVAEEVRDLIRRMKRENPTWGAPRIHGDLLALGFEISEPTVSRYLRRLKRIPEESKASQWLAFLNNHREVIAAFDFFTVPTLCFRTLYCFFAIEHDRQTHPALERDVPSHKRLDRATTAGGIPASLPLSICVVRP